MPGPKGGQPGKGTMVNPTFNQDQETLYDNKNAEIEFKKNSGLRINKSTLGIQTPIIPVFKTP